MRLTTQEQDEDNDEKRTPGAKPNMSTNSAAPIDHERWERLRVGSDDDRRQLLTELKSRVHEPLPPDLEHRRPCLLGPPEAYPDELAPASYFDHWPEHDPARMGATSEAVTRRLTSSCAGWERRPTAADFYAAVRAERPDAEQKALLGTWAREASYLDLIDAWGERVYTIRQLVAALQKVPGLYTFTRFRWLNRMALAPEAGGVPLWTD